LDHLSAAVCSLASISERRLERLVNPDHSGLPAFLAQNPGLDSGFMLAQVTAASLVSENKTLAHPASVDTIPTSANKEDHVSMGVHAARKAASVVDNVTTVLAIELMLAAQALDLRKPLTAGTGVEAGRRSLRRYISRLREDRVLAGDIERLREVVAAQSLRRAVEKTIGTLE
jgi:histidine ammonia-lyase